MRGDTKYVMLDGIKPIIFHQGISHDSFKALGNITSAGFVKIYYDPVDQVISAGVYGESLSLKLKPNPQDADLIKMAMGHGGNI